MVTLPSVGVHGIRLDLPKRELGIDRVSLTGADVRAWLAEDGVINFTPLFAPVPAPSKASGPTEGPAPAATGASMDRRVRTIEVEESQVELKIGLSPRRRK
ncbi:MAG: hypothetical protein MRJ92_04695 [Nitrospira sp.]|nr:hypothetical protein [Nitrospira sp.]